MTPRTLLAAVATVAALAVPTVLHGATAGAITYGTPDGNTHPEVAGLVADTIYSDGTWIYCTGTLVSPTVVVTAAHCGDPGQTRARVTFVPQFHTGDATFAGTFIPDPLYGGAQSDPHDLAVIVLDKAQKKIHPARLPGADLLDTLRADGTLGGASFTSVGYGALAPVNGPGGKTYIYTDTRNMASGSFNTLTSAWLKLSQNPSTGNGGTCFGDSGGPNFLGDATSDLLVATTISGDSACRSTNVDYRLDTVDARAFLGRFVALP